MLLNLIDLCFSLFIVFLVYHIINTPNIVESVLLLILLAINFSLFLFFYKISFLAILYLAVYIGAVAVFFLFVVMMTDLSNSVLSKNDSALFSTKYKSVYFMFITILAFSLANLFITTLLLARNNFKLFSSGDNLDIFNTNIETIAFSMFNEHAGPFILISLIILVSLIGSIFITTIVNKSEVTLNCISPSQHGLSNISDSKSQDMENQATRSLLNSLNLSKK
jgi:NADH-quinone oxidoreductase subunit J